MPSRTRPLRSALALAAMLAAPGAACSGDSGGDPDASASCQLPDLPGVCPGRGFYTDAVTVELGGPEASDVIYYTLDGSEPDPEGEGTLIYDGTPLTIDPDPDRGAIATLRVVAYHEDDTRTRSVTHSYVFPDRVLAQPTQPGGVPTVWGFSDNLRDGDYEVDTGVFAGDDERAEALDALRSIPTVSIVTAPGNLWTPVSGVYMRPDAVGDDFERPVSVELLVPDNGAVLAYQVGAGLSVQGGSSTFNWKSAKLSLRLAFRSEYGASSFVAPVFDDSEVTAFENLILDAHLNYTYVHPDEDQRTRSQYARDRYMSRLQLAVGSLAPHTRPVHLYLNGLYWGLYDLHERPDAHFAASYLGGSESDWDVLRHDGANVVAGDVDAWNQMFTLARAGLDDGGNYASFGGFLDIDAFIDYMLINFYAGNEDWDHHNWYAARDRRGGGFLFFSWDAEKVLVDVAQDSTAILNMGAPTELWSELGASADFRSRVSTRAAELYGPGGALHVNASAPSWDPARPQDNRPAALYMDVTDALRPHILLECARWGDNRVAASYTRETWDAERQSLLETYFPARSATAESQLPP